jgi:hypothetical protein
MLITDSIEILIYPGFARLVVSDANINLHYIIDLFKKYSNLTTIDHDIIELTFSSGYPDFIFIYPRDFSKEDAIELCNQIHRDWSSNNPSSTIIYTSESE